MSNANAETGGPMAVMQMLQGSQDTGFLNAGIELNVFLPDESLTRSPRCARRSRFAAARKAEG